MEEKNKKKFELTEADAELMEDAAEWAGDRKFESLDGLLEAYFASKVELINGVPHFKAHLREVTLKDGFRFTVSNWGDGVVTKLPKADVVAFHPNAAELVDERRFGEMTALHITWRDFYEASGQVMEFAMGMPSETVYFLTPERPTDAQRAELVKRSFDLATKQGVRHLKKAVDKAKRSQVMAPFGRGNTMKVAVIA